MGITDFASFRQVQAMLEVFEESRGRLHLGVMMNCKTLHGIETMTKNQQLSKLVEASPSCAQEAHPLSILNQSKDPWALGAAVILSAHCTDAAVNKVMDSLLARFPTPESITGARRDDIVPLLPGISHGGNKADYLVNWARHLLRKTSRVAPTIGELTKVKGIGRKTASIILHAAWGLDEGIPLDAHCQRILERIGYLPGTPNPNTLEQALLAEFSEGQRYGLHLILTLHGRKVCTGRAPRCGDCCIKECCPSSLARKNSH